MRVAFTGSHGVGKTTAAYILKEVLSEQKPENSVFSLGSATRSVLDWGNSSGALVGPQLLPEDNGFQLACIYDRRAKMLDALALQSSHVISERWALDETAYQLHKVRASRMGNDAAHTLRVCQMEMNWELNNYWDRIYYIPVTSRAVEGDGTRPIDKGYQEDIDRSIRYSLKSLSKATKIKIVPTELGQVREFFKEEVNKW